MHDLRGYVSYGHLRSPIGVIAVPSWNGSRKVLKRGPSVDTPRPAASSPHGRFAGRAFVSSCPARRPFRAFPATKPALFSPIVRKATLMDSIYRPRTHFPPFIASTCSRPATHPHSRPWRKPGPHSPPRTHPSGRRTPCRSTTFSRETWKPTSRPMRSFPSTSTGTTAACIRAAVWTAAAHWSSIVGPATRWLAASTSTSRRTQKWIIPMALGPLARAFRSPRRGVCLPSGHQRSPQRLYLHRRELGTP